MSLDRSQLHSLKPYTNQNTIKRRGSKNPDVQINVSSRTYTAIRHTNDSSTSSATRALPSTTIFCPLWPFLSLYRHSRRRRCCCYSRSSWTNVQGLSTPTVTYRSCNLEKRHRLEKLPQRRYSARSINVSSLQDANV